MPNPNARQAAHLRRRKVSSLRGSAAPWASPSDESLIDLSHSPDGHALVAVEKGQSYTLTDPVSGKALAVDKVQRIGKSLHVHWFGEQSLELQDFFVGVSPFEASAGAGATPVQSQAQFVFYTGTSGCLYGIVDALVPSSQWGPLEEPRTLWRAEQSDLCPSWATSALALDSVATAPPIHDGLLPYVGDGLIVLAALWSATAGRDSPVTAPPVADLVIVGNATLGPILAGNDLRVTAYDATGHALASPVTVDTNGHYSITVRGGHQGAVTLRLTSAGDALDYVSQAPIVGTDEIYDLRGLEDLATGVLLATGVPQATGPMTLNITALTDMAARLLVSDPETGGPTLKSGYGTADILAVNQQITQAYLGLDFAGQDITTLAVDRHTVSTDATASLSPGRYGLELHNQMQLVASQGGLDLAQQAMQAQISYDSLNKVLSANQIGIQGDLAYATTSYEAQGTGSVFQAQLTSIAGLSDVTYSITGGVDAPLFSIDHYSGEIFFNTPPDYSAPTDSDHNNTYQLILTAQATVDASAKPLTDSQLLVIAVEQNLSSVGPVLGA